MGCPAVQRVRFFRQVRRPVIDARHALNTASTMCGCIPILAMPVATVRRISWTRQQGIFGSCSSSPALPNDRPRETIAKAEHEIAANDALSFVDDSSHRLGHWHHVLALVLGARRWEHDHALAGIDFRPEQAAVTERLP